MATCVEVVGALRRCGAPATHELVSERGERLMCLCDDHAAWWRRALGERVRPMRAGELEGETARPRSRGQGGMIRE